MGVCQTALVSDTDPSQCVVLLFDGGVQILAAAMEVFELSYSVQVAAMSTLTVALAHGQLDNKSMITSPSPFILCPIQLTIRL